MELINCPNCRETISRKAIECHHCGYPLREELGLPPIDPMGDDVVATIIPYKNPWALAAYYTAIVSLIPILGMLLGAIAVVLGCVGLAYRAKNAKARGAVHAWIGIFLGGLIVVVHAAAIVVYVIFASGIDWNFG